MTSVPADLALLTTEEMGRADRLTIDGGIPGTTLMENAGRAVADAILARYPAQATLVLCGPGNNGGDGWVVARRLKQAGFDVACSALAPVAALRGDAAVMAARWNGPVLPFEPAALDGRTLIVDALFGAGLARDLDSAVLRMIEAVGEGRRVVAVDLPSGVNGDDGTIRGGAFTADLSVTFFRAKPGHLLYPGRARTGQLVVADIGISPSVLESIDPKAARNGPALFARHFPVLRQDGHKYDRGHTVTLSGGALHTGAARLAARAALRIGSGLVSTIGDAEAARVIAAHQTAVMVAEVDGPAGLALFLSDRRRNAAVIGPAAGVGDTTFAHCRMALAAGCACVFDADALTSAAGRADILWRERTADLVLTPHDGEFARLFPQLSGLPSRAARAVAAAKESGAVVVLKGADCCIAAPDGRIAINDNAPPTLATAGSGDVLAGMIGGLLAQHMPAFEAAAAAVWLHGAAAEGFGRGLIAEDLVERLPIALQIAENHLRGRGQAG
ncbi:NAD(P)H-hydrate dehydratase [Zavarzinia aquatilis]|uniref:Bifunctional NAD(P)H-hydrate repair enzyme n=1 Tax=Zavarzinia aquatilis TaxID=2211142 RepID=A0A317EG36_9PROT|nr:NAD(P)H-hydrate dehydratase [Zavarzinia aquatilis]PWR25819.1 bifunctional ADP-dependent NAD(P)H-hydrate dehydratase/NAD(P)H-hydrate epimerase [Zavarzinia aquatilis]